MMQSSQNKHLIAEAFEGLANRLSGGRIVEMREYQDSAMCERILGPFPDQFGT